MKKLLVTIMLSGIIAAWTLGCSSSTAPMAGGSGAGNPTTTVALAMIADTGLPRGTATLAKTAAAPPPVTGREKRTLTIRDMDAFAYTIDTATIAVKEIHFLAADPAMLDAIAIPFNLSRDAKGIVIPGPFIFDVIRGTVTPSIDGIALPSMRYSGISLLVRKKGLALTDTYAVEVGGNVAYANTVHRFSVKLLFNLSITYRADHGDFILDGSRTAHIAIALNASQWLDSVDLGSALNKDKIAFDTNGTLVIDAASPDTVNSRYEQAIRRNIIASGVLVTGW
jgi:hypothetical protein